MMAARSIIAVLAIGALIFGFQNCAKVALSEVEFSDASLQAIPASDLPNEGAVDDSGQVSDPVPGSGDGQVADGGSEVPEVSEMPEVPASGSEVPADGSSVAETPTGGSTSTVGNGKGKDVPKNNSSDPDSFPSEEPSSGNIVECELNSPKNKIVLSGSVAIGSNAQVSRICMSEYACLEMVNSYAVSHDCSLSAGPATSPSSNGVQCTKVFPGSKGTCKNAKVLSDSEVADLLSKLGS